MELEYGTLPPPPEVLRSEMLEERALDGGERWTRTRLDVAFVRSRPDASFSFEVTTWWPSPAVVEEKAGRAPGFGERGVPVVIRVGGGVPFFKILEEGYALASFDHRQVEPDEIGLPVLGPARAACEEVWPGRHSWGSIGAWAWAAGRVVDHVVDLRGADPDRVVLTGHSRNGKAALLAGALDERVALVNPNGSGCAGAGSFLALGDGCEDLAALTARDRWWAWTTPGFAQFAGREVDLPFDQHFLTALVAPRPLLRTEGFVDVWANPEGTCVNYLATQPVYDFLGARERNGIHFRDGGHGHWDADVDALVEFADWHLFGVPPTRRFDQLVYDASEFPKAFDWEAPALPARDRTA
ncbi:MAG: hypothetical protein Kow0069_14310 [Promethearchaeota archaeon]